MANQGAGAASAVHIRPAQPDDAPACGKICYEAFHKINTEHGFPPEIPSADMAVGLLSMMFSHPGVYAVVAELDGRIVGSNCMDERSVIGGVGPITIDPAAQNGGIGRRLMQAVLERAREKNLPGVRLLQGAFHNRSLSLYTKLGFDPREPMSVMRRIHAGDPVPDRTVRPALESDLAACNRLCRQVHGHDRGGELSDAIRQGTALVVEHAGRITGYATVLGFFGHAVAETNPDLQALIASQETFAGPGIIVPTRNATLLRWCLQNGLRVVEPLTLMSVGLYNEPAGAYLPSILY
jgi:predicted N-acetyltransferase YhbS